MHGPLAHDDVLAASDAVPAHIARFLGDPSDVVGAWVEAEHLFEDLVEVRQLREILERRAAALEHGVQLSAQRREHGGVLRQEVPGPRERRRRRIVPGKKSVTSSSRSCRLDIPEPSAYLAPSSIDKRSCDGSRLASRASTSRSIMRSSSRTALPSLREARTGTHWAAAANRSTPAVEEILDRVGARFDHGAAGSHVGAEEGARHDVEREGAHVGVQIALLVRHERVDVSLRAFDRDLTRSAGCTRGGTRAARDRAAFASDRRRTSRDLRRTWASRPAGPSVSRSGLIGDEDALDEIGVADEVERDAVEAKARDGAELALAPRRSRGCRRAAR